MGETTIISSSPGDKASVVEISMVLVMIACSMREMPTILDSLVDRVMVHMDSSRDSGPLDQATLSEGRAVELCRSFGGRTLISVANTKVI